MAPGEALKPSSMAPCKELANDAATLKSMYIADINSLSAAQRAKVKAEYEPKFAAIEAKRTQIEADLMPCARRWGCQALAPAPSPSPTRPRPHYRFPRKSPPCRQARLIPDITRPAKWERHPHSAHKWPFKDVQFEEAVAPAKVSFR